MRKQHAWGLGVVGVLLVVGAVVMQGCTQQQRDAEQPTPEAKQAVPDSKPVTPDSGSQASGSGSGSLTVELGPLTPETIEALGAAARVPDDVSAFSSSLHLVRQWQRVWQSNAVQSLVALPTLQQMWMQTRQHPNFTALIQTLDTHPLAVQGLPVLRDAFSTEVFVCTGPDLPGVLAAVGGVYAEAVLLGAVSGFEEDAGGPPSEFDVTAILEAVLEYEDQLRMPSLLIGFRLTDIDAATKLLDAWIPRIPVAAVGEIEKRTIQETQFYVLAVSGEQVPDENMQQIIVEMEKAKVPTDMSQRLVKLIRSQRVSVAVGVVDGYLMLSLGRDTSLLERWGKGPSLAASSMLGPARSLYKDGLLSLNYTAAALDSEPLTVDDIEKITEYFIEAIPEGKAPPQFKERLRKDVKLVASELVFPEPHATVSFSFDNKGIESYIFGGPFPSSLDPSKPLSILAHRGERPIVVAAGRAARNPDGYDQVVKWLKIAFGYFQDFVVPKMGPEDRERYDKTMGFVTPFLVSVDTATRDHLIPAVDGTQSLLLLDGQGVLEALPGGDRLPQPLALPRLGAAIELNDAEQFKMAIAGYVEALRKLLTGIDAAFPQSLPPGLALPSPVTIEKAGGTLYHYRLPADLGPDIFPCALFKGRLLVLASSSRLAEEMAGEQPMPSCSVTGPAVAAGSVTIVEFGELWDYLRRLGNGGLALFQKTPYPPDPNMIALIKMHIDAVARSLSSLRSYRSTMTQRDGRAVQHSWFHVEDIGR